MISILCTFTGGIIAYMKKQAGPSSKGELQLVVAQCPTHWGHPDYLEIPSPDVHSVRMRQVPVWKICTHKKCTIYLPNARSAQTGSGALDLQVTSRSYSSSAGKPLVSRILGHED